MSVSLNIKNGNVSLFCIVFLNKNLTLNVYALNSLLQHITASVFSDQLCEYMNFDHILPGVKKLLTLVIEVRTKFECSKADLNFCLEVFSFPSKRDSSFDQR